MKRWMRDVVPTLLSPSSTNFSGLHGSPLSSACRRFCRRSRSEVVPDMGVCWWSASNWEKTMTQLTLSVFVAVARFVHLSGELLLLVIFRRRILKKATTTTTNLKMRILQRTLWELWERGQRGWVGDSCRIKRDLKRIMQLKFNCTTRTERDKKATKTKGLPIQLFDLTPFMVHNHKLFDISCKKQASKQKQKHAIKNVLIVSKNSSFSSRFKFKDKIVQPFGTRVGFFFTAQFKSVLRYTNYWK